MYCVGLEIGAIVWIGLVAVVLMGAYWDRSSDRPLPTMKDMALPPQSSPLIAFFRSPLKPGGRPRSQRAPIAHAPSVPRT